MPKLGNDTCLTERLLHKLKDCRVNVNTNHHIVHAYAPELSA
jgi:hypothetical protein